MKILLLDTVPAPGGSDIAAIVIVVLIVVWIVWRRMRKKNANNAAATGSSQKAQPAAKDATAYGFISKDPAKGISMEEAQKLRDDFLKVASTNDKQKETNAAAGLMMAGAYDAAIEAYGMLRKKYPDDAAKFMSQEGAAQFFKGDYDEAVALYVAAKTIGMNAGMMDDNIFEAAAEKHKKTGDTGLLVQYLLFCGGGRHESEVNSLLRPAGEVANPEFAEDYGLGSGFETFIDKVFKSCIHSRSGNDGPLIPSAILQMDEDDEQFSYSRYLLDNYSDGVTKAEEKIGESGAVYGAATAEISLKWNDGKKYDALFVKAYNADLPSGFVFAQRFTQKGKGDVERIGKYTLLETVETVM